MGRMRLIASKFGILPRQGCPVDVDTVNIAKTHILRKGYTKLMTAET